MIIWKESCQRLRLVVRRHVYLEICSINDATSLSERGNLELLMCPWTSTFSSPCFSWSFWIQQPLGCRFTFPHLSKQIARCTLYPCWSALGQELPEGLSTWDPWMSLSSKYCQRNQLPHSSATWVIAQRISFAACRTYSFSVRRRDTSSNPQFCLELASTIGVHLQRTFTSILAIVSVSCRWHWIQVDHFLIESLVGLHWRDGQCQV